MSFCTCSRTNAKAKTLHLNVFLFTSMLILHIYLKYLVHFRSNNSEILSILVSKLRFPVYIFLGSLLLFLPDCYCFCYCVSSIISFPVGDTSFFFFSSFTDGFCYCFQNIILCFKECFNYFILFH